MKKLVSAILTCTLVLTMFAGCASGSTAPSSSIGTAPAPTESSAAPATAEWPKTTVQLVQPNAGGGTYDVSIRLLSSDITDRTRAPFNYVNTTAGNGAVAFETVRTAKPDGNTILVSHFVFYVKYLTGMYQYNPVEDFDVVCSMRAANPYVLLVRADSPWQTADDLAKAIRENPETITCGLELGGTSHVMAGMFAMDAGGKFKYVEAGGTNTKIPALLGGNIQVTMAAIVDSKQYIDSGELRSLGMLTAEGERDEMYPDYPTLVELGYKNCVWEVPLIVFAPKGTPMDIQKGIFEQYKQSAGKEEISKKLSEMNQPTVCLDTIEESKAYAAEKLELLKKVCIDIGLAEA